MPQLMPLNWCMSFLMLILLCVVGFMLYSDCLKNSILLCNKLNSIYFLTDWKW